MSVKPLKVCVSVIDASTSLAHVGVGDGNRAVLFPQALALFF